MPIETDRDLERAVSEYQRLVAAPDDSPQARRRADLDAEIKAYYARHSGDLRPSKPG